MGLVGGHDGLSPAGQAACAASRLAWLSRLPMFVDESLRGLGAWRAAWEKEGHRGPEAKEGAGGVVHGDDAAPPVSRPRTRPHLDPAPLQKILASKGESKDGMFKAVFGRTVKMPCGCTAGKEMGVNTWAAFAGENNNALVDGDFVVLEGELQPVLKSLRKSGINIVAIHHHMVGETPRTVFLHYWGRGPASELAQAVKSALAKVGKGESN